ncbi:MULTISPECIES: PucR family transcriptional regulator [unclassified Pseudonocardia]|uniref:helix-turn-helix domain-containing protein n=1 Tax=unclassified Pseudonocardia TaxID=2619320 RepID=UPI00094ADE0A|nr:PucR family transcriptional regulator [Pseudonocardia sp. Ae707_Ps1]OLM20673.1 regulatory protein [Pseudonocardia sp. Ae707_Ps1]
MDLDDLLDRGELGLVPVVPGRRVPVHGAHVVEIPQPTRWVPPGWVLLTTGLRLTSGAECRELVAELAGGGVAGLGFGVGMVHDDVPDELVTEARRRELPLFAVPEATPFREIVRAVDTAVLDRDLDAFRRAAAITDTLTALLGGPDPAETLVHGLARVLRCGVALHRPDGSVLAADPGSGPDGARERWTRFRALPATGPPVEVVDADGLFAAAVRPAGRVRAWLVAGVSRGSVPVPLIVRAVALVARLLAGLTAADDDDTARRRADRAAALHALLSGGDGEHGGGPGPGPGGGRTVVVLPPSATAAGAERVLDDARAPYLLAEIDGELVAMVTEVPPELTVAGTATIPPGAEVAPAHRDARLAARRCALTGAGPVRAEDLPVLDRMVLEIGADRVAELTRDVLTPLDAALRATVRTWLAHRQDVPATARALHVHENSVRHRLGRIRALVGDLRDPAVTAAVYLALLTER